MSDDTAAHVEKATDQWDVIIAEHKPRGSATALFEKTRNALELQEGGRCWLSGMTAEESGHPLEAHHYPVERCFAEAGMVDWDLFKKQALAGDYGPRVQSFDWANFDPANWETFVDDMRYNGRLLAKQHHIMVDTGIHNIPHPIWLAQRFVKDGVQYNHLEKIHRTHVQPAGE